MRRLGLLEPELDWFIGAIAPGGLGIDAGANWGIYARAMARVCARVAAFEPQPWCAATLRSYARVYAPAVTVYETALSDVSGSATLYVPGRSVGLLSRRATGLGSLTATPGAVTLEVSTQRVDDLDFSGVRALKIDVEGHEAAVLRGAERTVARDRPVLLVEIEQRHLGAHRIEDVIAYVLDLGYRGHFLRDGTPVDVSAFRVERDQSPYVNELPPFGAHPRYVNNFLFTPASPRV